MRYFQNGELYSRLPMKNKSVLPDAGFPVADVEVAPGLVMPVYATSKGRGSHRVFVVCDCGRHVPFGRMHQHKCKR